MIGLTLSAFAIGLSQFQTVHAWGSMAHMTTALIAQHYLTPTASSWVSGLLGAETMASASTWADSYRSTQGGAFSAPYHYIDALDNPPGTCNVDYNRDCTSQGCVVSAIANYTGRVNNMALPSSQRTDALKFLIHFLGDITQPLHCENLALGGNQISVLWSGSNTNLHSVWDTSIPQKISGGSTLSFATSWANTLITQIDTGIYASEKSGWISCNDIATAQTCAMVWATDANANVCSYVIKDGVAAVQGHELSGTYYTGGAPVASVQVAKAGYRLANWLNALAA